MPNLKEAFVSARQRINPEGLVFSVTASATSLAVLPPLGVGATYVIHEVASVTDPTLMKIAGIAVIAACNTVSVVKETNVLDSDNYSASPVSTTLNVLTGKPLLSSIGGHIANYAPITLFNPINAYAIVDNLTEVIEAYLKMKWRNKYEKEK